MKKPKEKLASVLAFEAGAQIAQSHSAARLARGGWWNPYATTGSSVVVYKRGEEPALPNIKVSHDYSANNP